jgi:hypothetical protein
MHRTRRHEAVDRLRRTAALLALLAGEALAVLALTRLGDQPPFAIPDDAGRWLRSAPPVDVLSAVIRLIALGCAWWLLVTTAACILVRVCRLSAGIRLTAAITLPAVRRAVDRALVVSVVVGTLSGAMPTARADTGGPGVTDPPIVVVRPDAPTASVRAGRTDGIAGLPGTTAVPAAAPVTTAASPTPAASPPPVAPPIAGSVTVVAGDNLWVIAARQLAAATARERASVSDEEVARYWVGVCERNRPRLVSGDVNLIYPGEVVELPAV